MRDIFTDGVQVTISEPVTYIQACYTYNFVNNLIHFCQNEVRKGNMIYMVCISQHVACADSRFLL